MTPLVALLAGMACSPDKPGADTDQTCTPTLWYADADADGFGDPTASEEFCSVPHGFVADGTDCNDDDPAVHPAAEEVCDGVDNDCDGIDDPDGGTWYADADTDGFGDGASAILDCDQPAGTVADDADCDDGDADVYPGAVDAWYDGVDSDCAGNDDFDADGDGHATVGSPHGGTDCDDDNAEIHPDADEICEDWVDQDCTGVDAACGPGGVMRISEGAAFLEGNQDGLELGSPLHNAGDPDGDGITELWVGAPGWRPADGTSDDTAGKAYLVGASPLSSTDPDGAADTIVLGDEGRARLGYGFGAADVDGDGLTDAFVTVREDSTAVDAAGAVYLFLAPHGPNLTPDDAAASWFGTSTTVFGQDVAVLDEGTPGAQVAITDPLHPLSSELFSNGFIFLFPAEAGHPRTDEYASAHLYSATAYANFGMGLAVADINGDGIDDIVTTGGTEDETAPGTGEDTLATFLGPFEGGEARALADADATRSNGVLDSLGYAMDVVDLDGDGLPELVPGAFRATSTELWDGGIWVLSGPVTGSGDLSDVLAQVIGDYDNRCLGYEVSAHGDYDADGTLDLVTTGYCSSGLHSEEYTGRVLLFYGPLSGTISADDADAIWVGDHEDEWLGLSMVAGEDFTGDGYDDIAAGTYAWPDKTLRGRLAIIPGGPQE